MILYHTCPSCGSADISETLLVEDFSISGESFPIMDCYNCGLRFTNQVPEAENISRYYQAEQYISHSDTSRGLVNRLYHLVRRRTLQQKRKLVSRLSGRTTGSVLDIGSGTGSFLAAMQAAGWKIQGIEPDEIARANAQKLHHIKAIPPDASASLPDASFDIITMWHVLEHVHDLNGQMTELKRLLQQDGTIFIAVPNHTSYDARHYGSYWAAWDVPRHLYHFSPASMLHLCRAHGLEIVDTKPMWFDSFYVSMLSEQYASGKNHLLLAFAIGFISNLKALFNRKRCSSLIYVIRKTKP